MKKTLHNCFLEKTDNVFLQLIRYTFVGGFAFMVDIALLWFLTDLCNIHYLISATLSFIAGLTVNFFISRKWIFNNAITHNKKLEFLLFGLIGVVGLGINDLLLWLLTNYCDIHYMISKFITVFLVYFWNFFARKYLLYNKN